MGLCSACTPEVFKVDGQIRPDWQCGMMKGGAGHLVITADCAQQGNAVIGLCPLSVVNIPEGKAIKSLVDAPLPTQPAAQLESKQIIKALQIIEIQQDLQIFDPDRPVGAKQLWIGRPTFAGLTKGFYLRLIDAKGNWREAYNGDAPGHADALKVLDELGWVFKPPPAAAQEEEGAGGHAAAAAAGAVAGVATGN